MHSFWAAASKMDKVGEKSTLRAPGFLCNSDLDLNLVPIGCLVKEDLVRKEEFAVLLRLDLVIDQAGVTILLKMVI